MTSKKPIVDKGIIIYYDYDFIFNFLSDEEVGKTIRLLLETKDNPTLNPTDNANINNAYNYIAKEIINYKILTGGKIENKAKSRKCKKYKRWREEIFKRDRYKCQQCKRPEGTSVFLEAHHIKSFANNIELRFDLNNGITLCKKCHRTFHKNNKDK